MPPPFAQLTLDQFAQLLDRFPFQRRINAVHVHHTTEPDHRQFREHESIVAMWRHHTQVRGFRDIAQHVTIAPDGTCWLGRNWNLPPASAAGHNGNAEAGPFMFEMVGDFNVGRDPWQDPQRDAALRVIALVQRKFGLEPEALRFHREMSDTDCPGSALDRREIVEAVRALHAEAGGIEGAHRAAADEGPFGPEMDAVQDVLDAFLRDAPRAADPPEADHGRAAGGAAPSDGAAAAPEETARASGLSPEVLDALRPHLVNLNAGKFSAEGELKTSQGDVDAIFDDHLLRALEGARARGEKLRIVFYAHGGLVSESNGLLLAHKHVRWWRSNNVYPIYFVWETGLFETIGQLLRRSRQGAQRGLPRDFFDVTTDPIIEVASRALQGPRIWGGMKRSAEQAVAENGGARYVARRLKDFCDAHGDDVELHAVGHSAGSIFHSHFLPCALDLGVPSFRTGHFLAPAIRVDAFHQRLARRIGKNKGLDHLTIFTMTKGREQNDHCAGIYRKSLLYLIYYALEPEAKAPILGLEICLRADPTLRALLGLSGAPAPTGEAVWSVTTIGAGRCATASTTHGGFDDDAATMNSVLRRVLGKSDTDKIVEFPRARAGESPSSLWNDQVDWPEEIARLRPVPEPEISVPAMPVPAAPVVTPGVTGVTPGVPVSLPAPAGGGQRRALCVGIDAYPTAPLSGCVTDARNWQSTLGALGFATTLMIDGQVTHQNLLDALTGLVRAGRAGDVLVFQFAGHGATLPDASGDEGRDEAICPVDFADGRFLNDDDIAGVFAQIPAGVNLTCFIDCCHSGTISRFGVGVAASERDAAPGERARYVVPTPEMIAAHKAFRAQTGRARAFRGGRGPESLREVLFSACRDEELAWESNGHGDFTTRATQILRAGIAGLTHAEFQRRVTAAFGPKPRQHPELDCAPAAEQRALLQPLAGGIEPVALGAGPPISGNGSLDVNALAQALAQALAPLLSQMPGR